MKHGTGLGRRMVHWIVSNLGGTVTVSVDNGMTVSVVLPLATEVD